ncbi:ABC transporter substrate-binding protein [Arcobacteraceae bacterium]|nr:ABC transporter substrate-binding protein [Arcobacteraceae bacterium]
MKKLLLLIITMIIGIYFLLQEKKYTRDTILIGSSFPKTSVLKEYGNALNSGAKTYFDYANDKHILKNKKINFITLDDKYEPKLTLQNTHALLKRKELFALYGFVGTPTVKNILPIIYKEEIPLIATFSGAGFLRNNSNENIINFRSSYKNEIKEHIKYLYLKRGFKRIAVFYQNDEYGEDGYISVVNVLKNYNLSPIAEGNYKRNTLSIRHAFNSIKDAKPEAIIMIGANKANTLFIKRAKQNKDFNNTIFCNISFGDASEMIKDLGEDNENIIFSQVVPNYQDKTIPIIQEYYDISKQYNTKFEPNFVSLEAFLSAKVMVTAIKNIIGEITRKKFIQSIRNLPTNTLDGISINGKNKDLLNHVYLFKYKKGRFIEVER